MSYSVNKNYQEEDINEEIRIALGNKVEILEEIKTLNQTSFEDLPQIAKEKLGINENQKNILVRVILHSLDQTLTKEYANLLLDEVYLKINQGKKD